MIHAHNFAESNGETFRTNHLDVYPHSLIEDALLFGGGIDSIDGRETTATIARTPSQLNALKGLSKGDVEASRERILAALKLSNECKGEDERMMQKRNGDFGNVRPTVVQIAGHDPDIAVKAALMILEQSGHLGSNVGGAIPPVVAAIDLNLGEGSVVCVFNRYSCFVPEAFPQCWNHLFGIIFPGCPQSIARKGNYGSFLHDEYPQSAYDVLSKLRRELPMEIGITAKIRLPPTQADADAGKLGNFARIQSLPTVEERMHRLIDCGVDLITVHGRTRFENKVAVSAPDWSAIRRCVEAARRYSGDEHYPVFANGGIESFEDVTRCFEETGASGVMSSESLLENPGLFKGYGRNNGGVISARNILEQQLEYADTYLDYATVFPPVPGSLGSKGGCFNVIRSHMFKFLYRYLEENPDLRSSLGNQNLHTIKEARDLVSEIRSRYEQFGEEELSLKRSSSEESSWYRRHRQQGRDVRSLQSHSQSSESPVSLSVEERKKLAKSRIQKLREERIQREAEANIAA